MIPLAQYLNDLQGDEFVPLRAVERRVSAPVPAAREPRAEPPFVRSLKPIRRPVPQAVPAASAFPPESEARVPLAELEAARESWTKERQALESAIADAREQGAAEGASALRAELDESSAVRIAEERAELEARHAEALAVERARWTEEQADRLADLMILQMAVFEDTMRATVRNVLRPLAMDARQRQALENLADAVKVIAPEGSEFRLAATGPSDLLAKLRERLGDKAGRLVVKADETRTDIRIEADSTTIETRLSSWGKALEKALS